MSNFATFHMKLLREHLRTITVLFFAKTSSSVLAIHKRIAQATCHGVLCNLDEVFLNSGSLLCSSIISDICSKCINGFPSSPVCFQALDRICSVFGIYFLTISAIVSPTAVKSSAIFVVGLQCQSVSKTNI
jgi:hypothetical protein